MPTVPTRALLLAAACALVPACVAFDGRVRSTDLALPREESRVSVPESPEEAFPRVVEQLGKRGLFLTQRHDGRRGTVFIFKGERPPHTWVYEEDGYLRSRTAELGTVVFVRLTPTAQGTDIDLLGKPSRDRRILCSWADESWDVPCTEVSADAYALNPAPTAEAELLRGTVLELRGPMKDLPVPAVVEAPVARCVAEQLPEWSSASAVRKRELLQRCHPARR